MSVYNVRDLGSIPGLGRFPGEGNDNPLQYSCLENLMDGGAWCRLLSMGSQRVGHDFTFTFMDGALKELWILLSSFDDCCVLLEQEVRLLVLSGAGFKFFLIKAIFIIFLVLGYGLNRFQWEV